MKVIKHFFCSQEFKAYSIGDEYNGKRTDLKGLVEYPIVKAKHKTKK